MSFQNYLSQEHALPLFVVQDVNQTLKFSLDDDSNGTFAVSSQVQCSLVSPVVILQNVMNLMQLHASICVSPCFSWLRFSWCCVLSIHACFFRSLFCVCVLVDTAINTCCLHSLVVVHSVLQDWCKLDVAVVAEVLVPDG